MYHLIRNANIFNKNFKKIKIKKIIGQVAKHYTLQTEPKTMFLKHSILSLNFLGTS